MPVIGKWYDYLGLDAGQRQLFYNNVEKLVGSYGFEVAKFSDKEYEPYLMMDSEHLGWKGWLYVDEKIVSYCNKN
jgi:D-alanine transfer protein